MALAGAALSLAPSPAGASAQTGTIRFIVGLAPGGAVDPYARIIAEHMAKTLGRTIIVENRPGATGNISAQFMIDAPADGQLIWVGTQALTEINPERVRQSALVDRRFPAADQGRAGAAGVRGASERSGRTTSPSS